MTGCCNPPPLKSGWSATTCGGRFDSLHAERFAATSNATFAYVNRYSEIYTTARGAAWSGSAEATETELIATVKNISAMHSVFMESSLPDWLQDQLVNAVSHVRDGYWFSNVSCPECTRSADPRTKSAPILWRQFEAFDCTDLDSIHNDGERHIPYIMLWPEAEVSFLWKHPDALF